MYQINSQAAHVELLGIFILERRYIMFKRLSVITALVFVLAIPTMAAAFGESLCDYPFGTYGIFETKFDQRFYDPDYYIGSNPNGGVCFDLFLGLFPTEQERDRLVRRTKRVIFHNKTTGAFHMLTKPDIYTYVGSPTASYTVWFGRPGMVIGDWSIIVQYNFRFFVGTFTITEEMLDQLPPIAVDPEVLPPVGGFFDIIAPVTNGDQYRLRLFDDDGNFMTNDNMDIVGSTARYSYTEDLMGKWARIETRFYGMDWPTLISGGVCKADGMNPGGFSRSVIYFETTVVP
jgi:hypothetical protein